MFQERKQLLISELIAEAGKDPAQDRYHSGYIAALNDLLNIDVEEIQIQEEF